MNQIASALASGTTTYFQPPDPTPALAISNEKKIQRRLAILVGCVAFGLPIVMMIGTFYGNTCFRQSISHYYYAQFLGTLFVGMLVFIGGFLIAYTGEHWLEDVGSLIAGLGAICIAIFPTTGVGCGNPAAFLSRVFVEYTPGDPATVAMVKNRDYFQLFEKVEHFHSFAAGALFIYLGIYCLFVMKRIIPERHIRDGQLIDTKRRRNVVYSICGIVILLCVAVLGWVGLVASDEVVAAWNRNHMTFYFETAALWAFGLAWLIKGRLIPWLNDTTPQAAMAP